MTGEWSQFAWHTLWTALGPAWRRTPPLLPFWRWARLGVLETWMSTNRLRHNPSTQIIWFCARQQLAKLDRSAIADELPPFNLFLCCSWPWSYTVPKANLRFTYSKPLSWFIGLLGPYQLHSGFLRFHRHTYSCLHYNPTRLLQLTLCLPPSFAVTVPRPGPALCRTPLSSSQNFSHVSRYTLDVLR